MGFTSGICSKNVSKKSLRVCRIRNHLSKQPLFSSTFVKRLKLLKIDENDNFCGRISLRKHQKRSTSENYGSTFGGHLDFCD